MPVICIEQAKHVNYAIDVVFDKESLKVSQ